MTIRLFLPSGRVRLAMEAVYILEMWAGRLEFVTLLALVVKVVVSIAPRRKAVRS